MANLISCENLPASIIAAVQSMTADERAQLCQMLNCGPDLLDYISAASGNQLEQALDGKLYVGKFNPVSTDAGNLVTTGTDGMAFLNAAAINDAVADIDPSALLSGDIGNRAIIGSDGKIYVRVDEPDPSKLISSDADNLITVGTDGGLLAIQKDVDPLTLISRDSNNRIVMGTDGGLYSNIINDDAKSRDTTYSSSQIEDSILIAVTQAKNDLLGGAGEAFDTLKELADLIRENETAIEALNALAAYCVRYNEPQTLTEAQKAQARENIGATTAGDIWTDRNFVDDFNAALAA